MTETSGFLAIDKTTRLKKHVEHVKTKVHVATKAWVCTIDSFPWSNQGTMNHTLPHLASRLHDIKMLHINIAFWHINNEILPFPCSHGTHAKSIAFCPIEGLTTKVLSSTGSLHLCHGCGHVSLVLLSILLKIYIRLFSYQFPLA